MTNTFGGRPISGDITHYSDRKPVEQKPLGDLLAALDAVFAFPEVESVRWEQYTPYFNDGEPCEFSVRDAAVRVTGVKDDAGDYEDGYLDSWSLKYDREYTVARDGKEPEYPQVGAELAATFDVLNTAVSGGAHEIDLRKHFGDPAQVTATREGFDVEFYEHD